MGVQLKRVYDKPAKADGRRILVDRIWPRGLKKKYARIDERFKEVALPLGCGNGSDMTHLDGRSLRSGTSENWTITASESSNSCGNLKSELSHCSLERRTQSITTPWR